MAEFSASEAAFSGFHFIREHPKVIAIWTLVRLVVVLSVGLPVIAAFGPAIAQVQALKADAAADPAATAALFRQLAPALVLMLPFMLVFCAVILATVNRAALRPAESRFAYLRLGMDEVRQGLLLLWGAVIALGVYIAYFVAAVAFAIMLGLSLGFLLGASGKAAAMTGAVVMAGIVAAAFLLAAIFFAVRLSLASPLTFDRNKVTLFGCWPLTRGRFWRLFGTYLLVAIFGAMLALGFFILSAAAAFLFGGGLEGMRTMMQPDLSSLRAYLSPLRFALIVLDSLFNTVLLPVMLMPAVTIYRRLRQEDAVPAAVPV